MMNFMNEKKQIIGILSILFMFAVYSNSANAAANVENNLLSQEAVDAPSASEEAFSISTAEEIRKKYENATSLTDLQLKELLKAVGFKGKHLKEAWAIAKRESGGNPLSFNGNIKTGDNSYGLFQVNMLGILGPDRRNKFELRSNAELFNPVLNAEIAFYMTDGGTDWSSWKGMTSRAKEWLTKFPA